MALDPADVKDFTGRLLLSRMRVLNSHPFFGLLLMHMHYSVDESVETLYTDGLRIVFGTGFLNSLSENELDFVMMHEIMHVALRHCVRGSVYEDRERFDTACDIIVNSNILLENGMALSSISIDGYGPSIHTAPDGREGHEFTVEQLYRMLPMSLSAEDAHDAGAETDDASARDVQNRGSRVLRLRDNCRGQRAGDLGSSSSGFRDDHSHWRNAESDSTFKDVWAKNIRDAGNAIEVRERTLSRGILPAFAKRLLKELRSPQTDWRQILEEFIQQDVGDYSFSPPDRRMDDSPFFLPAFNETEGTTDNPRNILFMIDTSGSISDEMMTAAYSEVKGAIDQFAGTLEGWLGFFDADIVEPLRFKDVDEFLRIEPVGGGGTDFQIIFEYVAEHMKEEDEPACIIILTDGYAPFPEEQLANGIPVLWLINNDDVNPPWGKVARI